MMAKRPRLRNTDARLGARGEASVSAYVALRGCCREIAGESFGFLRRAGSPAPDSKKKRPGKQSRSLRVKSPKAIYGEMR